MDRRYLRTEKQLIDSMLSLIKEKPYADITIEDIVNRADVARKTFYAHHENKNELLWHSLETQFLAIAGQTSDLQPQTLLMDGKPLSYPVFQHIYEYGVFYKSIFVEQGNLSFILRLWGYLAQESEQKHQALREVAPFVSIEPELVADMLSGALLGAVKWWIKNDLRDTPEQMAYRFSQLLAPGVLQSLGLED